MKNRVAPPLGQTELEIRYPLGGQKLGDYLPGITHAPPRVEELHPRASAAV